MMAMPRVLVVDDEPHIAELVSLGLRYSKFEVSSAATGREALVEVRRSRPDLIVLDVSSPISTASRWHAGSARPTGVPTACP